MREIVPKKQIRGNTCNLPCSHRLESAKVKTISDDELFALFPGRALALGGQTGRATIEFFWTAAPRGHRRGRF